jgi:uncharacterized protein (TIGR03000 family)
MAALTSQMPYSGYGMSAMSGGGYGGSGGYGGGYGGGGYGGYGMSAMPYGGYDPSQSPYLGYDSSSSSSVTPTQTSQSQEESAADAIKVSGPMSTPPPHRAIIRVRLPETWAEVLFDGQKVDSVGRERTYVTPELSDARTFEVTATWKNKGRTRLLQEEVTVRAGQVRTLDFTSAR